MSRSFNVPVAVLLAAGMFGCRTGGVGLPADGGGIEVAGVYEGFDLITGTYIRLRLEPEGRGTITAYGRSGLKALAEKGPGEKQYAKTPSLQRFPVRWMFDPGGPDCFWTFEADQFAVWPAELKDWRTRQADNLPGLVARARTARWGDERRERVWHISDELCVLPVALYRPDCVDSIRKITAEAFRKSFGVTPAADVQARPVTAPDSKPAADAPIVEREILGVYEGWTMRNTYVRLDVRKGGQAMFTQVYPPLSSTGDKSREPGIGHDQFVWAFEGGKFESWWPGAPKGEGEATLLTGEITREEWDDGRGPEVKRLRLVDSGYRFDVLYLARPAALDWVRKQTEELMRMR